MMVCNEMLVTFVGKTKVHSSIIFFSIGQHVRPIECFLLNIEVQYQRQYLFSFKFNGYSGGQRLMCSYSGNRLPGRSFTLKMVFFFLVLLCFCFNFSLFHLLFFSCFFFNFIFSSFMAE